MEDAGLLIDDPDLAAELLGRGGLVGLPTETVYGLAADARDRAAVARVFAVKGRPADHPLIVHVRGVGDLDDWGQDVSPDARDLAARFWPGPLTLIVRRSRLAGDHVTGGQDTVGLRAPAHPSARAVLTRFAALRDGAPGGLAAPSANRFGRVSPTTAAHVVAELGDRLRPGIDAVLDGGASQVGVESTILDCSRARPRVLRLGAITAAEIRAAGVDLAPPGDDDRAATSEAGAVGDRAPTVRAAAVRAPGTLAAHYAPEAAVHLVTAAELPAAAVRLGSPLRPVGVLAEASLPTPPNAVRLAAPAGTDHYAAALYAALREADALHLAHVLAVAPAAEGLGAAVTDRLRRAAVGSGGTP